MYGFCTLHGQRYYRFGDPEALAYGKVDDNTETTLYWLWNIDDDLLYVGVTVDLKRRFAQHEKVQRWWGDVARCEVEAFSTRTSAFAAERNAVATEHPRHNLLLRR